MQIQFYIILNCIEFDNKENEKRYSYRLYSIIIEFNLLIIEFYLRQNILFRGNPAFKINSSK